MASTNQPFPADNPFHRANTLCMRKHYDRWRRDRAQRYVLRSQLGFHRTDEERTTRQPAPCRHCIHYHGVAYGTSKQRRTLLICGLHPSDPGQGDACPDWSGPAEDPPRDRHG